MPANIRKTSVIVEETRQDIGREVNPPTRKAAALAVIENPFAGRYEEDLTELMDIGAELGELLGRMCVEALGIKPEEAEGYGKAAIVGENGEWEHAAAILHPKLGAPLRKEVEKGAALVPSVKKLGGPGTAIDIPLGHKDAAYVRSHFDGMENNADFVGIDTAWHVGSSAAYLTGTTASAINDFVFSGGGLHLTGENGPFAAALNSALLDLVNPMITDPTLAAGGGASPVRSSLPPG